MIIMFFFKQKTAYEMRISDWSSDVCSSDLTRYRTLGHIKHIASGKRGIARHRSRARHHVTGALYDPLRRQHRLHGIRRGTRLQEYPRLVDRPRQLSDRRRQGGKDIAGLLLRPAHIDPKAAMIGNGGDRKSKRLNSSPKCA